MGEESEDFHVAPAPSQYLAVHLVRFLVATKVRLYESSAGVVTLLHCGISGGTFYRRFILLNYRRNRSLAPAY